MIAIIDFTEKAREFALPHDLTKEILLFRGRGLKPMRRPYTETEVKTLLKAGWFVYDKTARKDVAEESVVIPKTHLILGRLQLPTIEGLLDR